MGDYMQWLIALVVFIFGLTAWKREYVGRRRIELAEDVLSLFYEAKDAISQIRSPLSMSFEGNTRVPIPNETDEERYIRRQSFIPAERYNQRREVFNKIMSLRYRFGVVFGHDKEKPFDDLNSAVIDILYAAADYGRSILEWPGNEGMEAQEIEDHKAEMKEYKSKMWENKSGEDSVGDKVNNVICEIERICKPILEKETLTDKAYEWIRQKI